MYNHTTMNICNHIHRLCSDGFVLDLAKVRLHSAGLFAKYCHSKREESKIITTTGWVKNHWKQKVSALAGHLH